MSLFLFIILIIILVAWIYAAILINRLQKVCDGAAVTVGALSISHMYNNEMIESLKQELEELKEKLENHEKQVDELIYMIEALKKED